MGKRGDGRRPGWKKGMERKWQHASAERILREMHEAGCSSASGSRTIRRDVHPAPPFLRQRSRLKDTWRCSHEPCTLTSKWRWKFHASRVQALHFWKLINQHFTRWNESYVNEYRELSMKIRFWFERFALPVTRSPVYTYLADVWYCFSNARATGEQKFRRSIENSVSVAVDRNLDIRGTSSKVQFRLSQWKFR